MDSSKTFPATKAKDRKPYEFKTMKPKPVFNINILMREE